MRLRVHSPEGTFDWESSSSHFRLGRGDACDLRIEGKASKFASWEHAGFSVGNDGGMYVTDFNSSNGTYVDGVRISGATPVRVGSIVQIGRAGTRLEVLALTSAAPAPPVAESARIQAVAAPMPVTSPTAPSRPLATLEVWPRKDWLIGAAIVLIAVGAFFISRAAAPSPQPLPPDNGKTANGAGNDLSDHRNDHPEQSANTGSNAVTPLTTGTLIAEDTPPVAPVVPPTTSDPWKEAKERGMAAYRLIVVEDRETQIAWPHAGSIVVGDHALLTTAGVAVDLQTARDRKWDLSVMKPPHGARMPIAAIRVQAGFGQADADKQLFFDSALLYVDEPLIGAIALASPDDLDKLERGQPLSCIGIDHDGDSLDRFHPLIPENFEREIFSAPRALDPKQSGSPRLLRMKGTLGARVLGSPIVDEQGHLVALYCGAAEELKAKSGLELSYAKVIDPEMIRSALERRDDPVWIEPVVSPTNPVEKEVTK